MAFHIDTGAMAIPLMASTGSYTLIDQESVPVEINDRTKLDSG
jgi:hypothetical protein